MLPYIASGVHKISAIWWARSISAAPLKNAISGSRISHAYLFTGPRGTGKTSSAKIMAKAVNCLNPLEGEPCGECASCLRINQGGAMDIVEIDAASNRGIDEIRDLREKVKYAPVESKYKVYIIDEVHMLTTEAFNALLKTLEEPPAHVIFILATTEPYKVPVTVLSRCQRFDFKRIGYQDIIGRLEMICAAGQLVVSPRALQMIARKAEGGLRDALSLLDQCVSFADGEIDEATVAEILGTVGTDFMVSMAEAIAGQDLVVLLGLVDDLVKEGKDLRQFLHDLLEFFRNFLLVKLSRESQEAAGVPEYLFERLRAKGALFSEPRLFAILQVLGEGESQLRYSAQPRISLEINLIKAAGFQEMAAAPLTPVPIRPSFVPAKPAAPAAQAVPPAQAVAAAKPSQSAAEFPAAAIVHEPGVTGGQPLVLGQIKEHWKRFLETVRKQRPSTYAYLVEGEPVDIRGRKILLSFKPNFQLHMQSLEQPNNRTLVEKTLLAVYGQELSVQGLLAGSEDKKPDLVEEAQKLFGVDLVEIKE